MSSAMTTRLLVASPLATVVSGHLEQLLAPAVVVTASTPVEIRAALHTRLRFDAILTDLVSLVHRYNTKVVALDVRV